MAASSSFRIVSLLFFLYIAAMSSLGLVSSSSSVCRQGRALFLNSLEFQCPLSISPNRRLEVDGNYLDRALTFKERSAYTSILFYASWCPFSCSVHPMFEVLSSMFPQIEHLAIEQSSALPSIFSRYGIHSMPSILMVNHTSRVRYRGPKNLPSLVQFYKKTTGLEQVQYFGEDEQISLGDCGKLIKQSWNGPSLKEMIKREPYLVFAILFLYFRVFLFIFPEVFSRLKAFWVSYVPHFNLEIFGETSQLLGRALHMIDVRRVWTKLRLCKTRNFHEGAMNARVWASSLASVSLGESSSARSSF